MQSPWIVAVNGRRVAALVGTTLSCLAIAIAAAFLAASRGPESGALIADPASGTVPAQLAQVGADPSWWQAVTDDLASAEYAATPVASGFQAPNRAQNMRTTFAERGIEIVPRTSKDVAPTWQFGWETRGFGRAGHMEEVAPASPEANGARVTYRRDGWSEWYENTPQGIEQGFTIERKPAGEGPLRIAGEFPVELRAEVQEDGAIDFMDAGGARVIRYGELHVWDAQGTELPAELEVAGTTLAIAIDDRGAEYPLLVDPLMTSPAWTAESDQPTAVMGFSVGTAGDVNGDGFSDVIVGAWLYDNGETDEGRAFVYHGSASGLSLTPSWTAEGDRANATFGYSVATAGDVNGDGYHDVVVGAARYDNESPDEGRAWVYHGSASGLSPTASWTAEGNQGSAEFGTSVATAGDVNNDGFSDIVVGAPLFDNDQSNEGRAFVYHGSAGGLNGAPSWSTEGNQNGCQFGSSVATAGDVNADGFSDVAVGSWVYTNGQSSEGRAFVYHGSAGGLSLTSNWSAESNQVNGFFGVSVAGAGDVNGDGFADVIVGAQGFTNGQSAEGRAFVYNGSTVGLSTTPAWTDESNLNGASFGHSVATAGDVNGDGYADVIVGASNLTNGQSAEGRVYVYPGGPLGPLQGVWTIESNQVAANFGISVGTAGDVNGDGFSDVIVGAWSFDNGHPDEGRAFVYHGSAEGPGATQEAVQVSQDHAHLGRSVASAGDVNGDGYSDVIVGAPNLDNGELEEGWASVYHGSASGIGFIPQWIAEGNQADASFGYSVASAGDVNGDGFSDVIVGASSYGNGEIGEGRAFVYHGSAAGLASTAAWMAEGNEANANYGTSVATAGDVNGDGFSDVIVGAPLYDNGEINEGRAFVYHGSAAGLASTAAWTAEGDEANANYGGSVATAGDVNGDGFSDVIVGAPLYDNGQSDQGRAFVYYGSAAGLASTAAWSAGGDGGGTGFGSAVGTAGDVNGDGYSDVIVGAPDWGHAGLVFVFHGSASGLDFANCVMVSEQWEASFGMSVSTAGDLNGDGFSDVIVGAPRFDNGDIDEGRTFVYRGSLHGLRSIPDWTNHSGQEEAWLGVSVSTAGDVNGDGFSDVIEGTHLFDGGEIDQGLATIHFGGDFAGLARIARQCRTDDSALIAPLGMSDSESAFRLKALGRTAAGRGQVRLQFEVKPFGVAFDGSGLETETLFDTGVPIQGVGSAVPLSALADGLTSETLYHWRLRIVAESPFFPHTPWFTMVGNNGTEADVRTASSPLGVAYQDAPPAQLLLLEPVRPNPIVGQAEIAYTLREAGEVRLTVVDVAGRVRAVVAKESQAAGRHSTRWNGRDRDGRTLPAGVYLLRLEAAGQEMTRKLVIAH